ncbi:hypothetical protein MTP04_02910 [Lysinibacillus sp. PLM2]|nr:hypothetical protein MTP04_02910 [Lysinibacillus sp. PLM2]
MAENINTWLAIIVSVIAILGGLFGGLTFIWKASGNLNIVLTNLNNGIARLNEHLTRVEERADKTDETLEEHDERLDDHETRIKIIEKWKDGEL